MDLNGETLKKVQSIKSNDQQQLVKFLRTFFIDAGWKPALPGSCKNRKIIPIRRCKDPGKIFIQASWGLTQFSDRLLAEVYKLALVRIWKTDLADQCAWFARCESEDADTDDVSGCSG
jgi:hypothetical protein